MCDCKEQLDRIEEKINIIIENNIYLQKDTTKMNKHIDFVDGIYQQIKKPFNVLIKKCKLIE